MGWIKAALYHGFDESIPSRLDRARHLVTTLNDPVLKQEFDQTSTMVARVQENWDQFLQSLTEWKKHHSEESPPLSLITEVLYWAAQTGHWSEGFKYLQCQQSYDGAVAIERALFWSAVEKFFATQQESNGVHIATALQANRPLDLLE